LSVRLLGQQSRQQAAFLRNLYQNHAKCVPWCYYACGRCRSSVRVVGRGCVYAILGLGANGIRLCKPKGDA
jgi:hypothetical protein